MSNILSGITLCTALLGLFLAMPLLFAARRRPANIWLGLFVFSISWLSLADYANVARWYDSHPGLLFLFDWPVAGLGASYYLYVLSLTGGFSRRQLWHLLPMLLWAGWLAYLRLAYPAQALIMDPATVAKTGFLPLLFAFQLLAAGYVVGSLRRLARHRQAVRDNYSNIGALDLSWLRWLTLTLSALYLLWLPASLLGAAWVPVLCVSRLVVLYLLGWFGLRQSAVFLPPAQTAPATEPEATPPAQTALLPAELLEPAAPPQEASPKYQRSGMTADAQALIGQRLQRLMAAEQLHRDPDLTLAALAQRIGTSNQLLSQYLNEALGQSFFEYVNAARVETVKTLLQDRTQQHHTVLDLAFMAGFSSKSGFNSSFKRATGQTPSQWKNQAARECAPIGVDDAEPRSRQIEGAV